VRDHYQRRGYGREAFEAKIRFAFCELGLTKLVNGYFDGNENSWAMQRKLGYRHIAEVTSRCDGRQTIARTTVRPSVIQWLPARSPDRLDDIMDKLGVDGVKLFSDAFDKLVAASETPRRKLAG
jgi:hypothetical protein